MGQSGGVKREESVNLGPTPELLRGVGPLRRNRSNTFSFAPHQYSPVIDAGLSAIAVDATRIRLSTDQRGAPFVREAGIDVDMGAVESQYNYLTVSTLDDESDAVCDAGDLSLREALQISTTRPNYSIDFATGLSGTIELTMGALGSMFSGPVS